jgi:Flp pilus assembly protein TadD
MSIEGFGNEGVPFPRPWCEALVERVKGDAVAERAAFTRARDRVQESFVGESDNPASFAVLGMIDAALGRKDDAIREARRAVELLPVEKDAINGALAIEYLAVTYAWTW